MPTVPSYPTRLDSRNKGLVLVPVLFVILMLGFIYKSMYADEMFESVNRVPLQFEDTDQKQEAKLELKNLKSGKNSSKANNKEKIKKQSRKYCNVFQQPGYYLPPVSDSMLYHSLTDCKPMDPAPLDLLGSPENDIPSLRNKTVLLVGDSVDRSLVEMLCKKLDGKLTITTPTSFYDENIEKKDDQVSGGYSRVCYYEPYDLWFGNYFFYGFDTTDDLWLDKTTYLPPGDYKKRLKLFKQALGTLDRDVDLVTVNMGFWELARFDRLDSQKGSEASRTLPDEQIKEYKSNLGWFKLQIDNLFHGSRIVYREMHYPYVTTAPFFASSSTIDRKYKTDPFKVRQLNEVASATFKETWPVGELIRDLPVEEYMVDDLHFNLKGLGIWGNGILEYLSRSQKKTR